MVHLKVVKLTVRQRDGLATSAEGFRVETTQKLTGGVKSMSQLGEFGFIDRAVLGLKHYY